jgi:hypothetical protein
MDDLIRRSDALAFQNEVEPIFCKSPITGDVFSASKDGDLVAYFDSIPAVDAVEVETVCDMFMHVMRDECPCNYCGVDEWLPEACELIDECPNPSDKMGCWKQFIKHYSTRLDYMDTAAMEAEQERMGQRREDGDT